MRVIACAVGLLACAPSLRGQEVVPATLTLDEAIEIARQNNPTFQQTRNNEAVADWDVRSAYGQLVPSASVGGGVSWQGSGEQRFGTLTFDQLGFSGQPSYWSSSYSLSLNYSISGQTLLAPGQAEANRRATVATIENAEADLVAQVTQGYIDVLRQQEQVRVSQQQLERAEFNFRIAEAQVEVGQASPIDEAQARVARSRAEVTLLQTQNAFETARIRLLQALGVDVHSPVTLTTPFELEAPTWVEDELFELGLETNPLLRSLQAGRSASSYGVKIARSAYLPSLSFSAGLSGFSQQASSVEFDIARAEAQAQSSISSCLFQNDLYSRLVDPLPAQDCSRLQFTDEQARAIRDRNDVFPFDFTNSPPRASMNVSIPIFSGLSRQRQVEAAQAALEDADLQLREQEIALRAGIAVGLSNVRTAHQAALLEQANQAVVDEQLRLAREQFSVGLTGFVDLLEAETLKVEADRTLVAAIFAYHDALAQLESAVGTRLRN